nr:MAG TPA_asm: hypothetical protein [Caudoviricetes sp.]
MAADRLALFFVSDRVLVGNALFAAQRVGVIGGTESVLKEIREIVGEDDPGATLGTFEALVDQLVDVVAELGLDLSSRSHVPGGLCEVEGVDRGSDVHGSTSFHERFFFSELCLDFRLALTPVVGAHLFERFAFDVDRIARRPRSAPGAGRISVVHVAACVLPATDKGVALFFGEGCEVEGCHRVLSIK